MVADGYSSVERAMRGLDASRDEVLDAYKYDPSHFSLRSLATIPVTAGAYGLAGMSAFAPEPTAQQAAEAEAINQQAQARGMMTLTPYEAQLLEQQMVFQEQAKQERDAIRQMVARRQEALAQEQAMATQGARQQQMNQYLQQRGY
jgi:hypothetical protein